jgi:hypothetical protein
MREKSVKILLAMFIAFYSVQFGPRLVNSLSSRPLERGARG